MPERSRDWFKHAEYDLEKAKLDYFSRDDAVKAVEAAEKLLGWSHHHISGR